jgi:integrase
MLRHTFATTWLKRRGNIRLLQKQLGHSKLESTAYYLDWMPEEVREEYDSLFNQREELATVTAS